MARKIVGIKVVTVADGARTCETNPACARECGPPIAGWDGPGWYCVRAAGTADDPEATELVEGDQFDDSIEIASGPYADEAAALAACGPPPTVDASACPADNLGTPLSATAYEYLSLVVAGACCSGAHKLRWAGAFASGCGPCIWYNAQYASATVCTDPGGFPSSAACAGALAGFEPAVRLYYNSGGGYWALELQIGSQLVQYRYTGTWTGAAPLTLTRQSVSGGACVLADWPATLALNGTSAP